MIVKRIVIRNALQKALDSGDLSFKQQSKIKLMLERLRPARLRAFSEWMDEFAVEQVGKAKAQKLGDGTLLKLILDNLDAIIAAIERILKLFGV